MSLLDLVRQATYALLEPRSHGELCRSLATVLAGAAPPAPGATAFETAAVFEVRPHGGGLELKAAAGAGSEQVPSDLRHRVGEAVAGEAARLVEPVEVAGVAAGGRPLSLPGDRYRAELAVPAAVRDRVVAVVAVLSGAPRPFGDDERQALSAVAHALALAWDRVDVNEGARDRIRELEARPGGRARLAELEQIRHADRLATVGNLAAGIAHEIGTPLNVAAARASMISSGELSNAEVTEYARIIVAQVDRISTIIRQLLDFARSRALRRAPTQLAELMTSTATLLRAVAEKNDVEIEVRGTEHSVTLAIDPVKLQQVLTNLAMNGLQSMPNGGKLTLEIAADPVTPPPDHHGPRCSYLGLHVRDTGAGIRPEHKAHLFEPFFTTKPVGVGTGLGLPVAYGIVREHGGWIDVESRPGRGSCFTVCLPRLEGPPA